MNPARTYHRLPESLPLSSKYPVCKTINSRPSSSPASRPEKGASMKSAGAGADSAPTLPGGYGKYNIPRRFRPPLLLRRGPRMGQRVSPVAFEGIEARAVDVQVGVAPGLPAFIIVGLPDKAVSEARERVRGALVASGLPLPARRLLVSL